MSNTEKLGPTEEDDSEFAKELAKMVTDAAGENKKVDRRTLWDAALPANVRKKAGEDSEDEDNRSDVTAADGAEFMKFTVLTKKGTKPQVCESDFASSISLFFPSRRRSLRYQLPLHSLLILVRRNFKTR